MKAIVCNHCGKMDSSDWAAEQVKDDEDILCHTCYDMWAGERKELETKYVADVHILRAKYQLPN